MRLPKVLMAYTLPDILPALAKSALFDTASRIAKGEAQPSNVTGTENKTSTAMKEPIANEASAPATAVAAVTSTGRATSGIRALRNAPHNKIL